MLTRKIVIPKGGKNGINFVIHHVIITFAEEQ